MSKEQLYIDTANKWSALTYNGDLEKFPTSPFDPRTERVVIQKDVAKEKTRNYIKEIKEEQYRLFAEKGESLLIVLQGRDCAGKDGLINNVFGPVNPQGLTVAAFKKPSELESQYDFLWRVHQQVPPKGTIKVFNRSHYEDVLVPHANNLLSGKALGLRQGMIENFEHLLYRNGTKILKFFLHISKDEQKRRLEERINDPAKRWKFDENDLKVRKQWKEYTRAYESVLGFPALVQPWHIVPSDKNWYKELFVAKMTAHALRNMNTAASRNLRKK